MYNKRKQPKQINYNLQSMNDVLSILEDLYIEPERLATLEKNKDHFIGGKCALNDKYFPPPSKEVEDLFNREKKALTHINLVRPIVRTWQSILSGSDIVRNINVPQNDVVEPFVNSYDYNDVLSNWVENALLYGTSVAVPMYNQDQDELRIWLPNPLNTVIVTNPIDVYDTTLIAELNNGFIQFVCKWGEGIVYEDGSFAINQRNYSYLPATIAYGIDRRHNREIYGLDLVASAVDFTIRQTNIAFNVTLLQKSQTRSILTLFGDINKILQHKDNEDVQIGFTADGKLILPEGFTADFLSPDPKISQSIEVQTMFSELLSTVAGIPQDIISANSVTSPSAEAARIRALPLLQQAKMLIPKWISYEKQLIHTMAYVVEYFRSNESYITLKNVKDRSTIDIKNQSAIMPVSPNEVTANVISASAAGLMRLEDAIKAIPNNNHLSEDDIKQMVLDYKKEKESASAEQIKDEAFKSGKEAFTDEQIAEKESEN